MPEMPDTKQEEKKQKHCRQKKWKINVIGY
jgi:hypothetical protein